MKVLKPNTLTTPDGSFTRASSGTYTDNTGVIRTASNNVPRFDYNFTTALPEGVLIEDAKQNGFQFTEDFSNAFWTKTGSAITTNVVAAPDETTTADLFKEDASNGVHEISGSFTVTNATAYSHSFFVKAAGRTLVALSNAGVSWTSASVVYFDLTTLAVSDAGAGVYRIEKLATGWFRISRKNTTSAAGTGAFKLALATGTIGTPILSYAGDNASGVYLWGAQLELNNKSSYVANLTGTLNTRAADTITGSGIIYSSAVETVAAWNSGTTYALDAQVRYAEKIWTSIQASNTNHVPTEVNSTWWVEFSPDNKHSMFDKQVNTITTATTVLNVIVKPGTIDSAALINLLADVVHFTVRDSPTSSGNIVYQDKAGLSGGNVGDWYEYFFSDPLLKRTQLTFQNIPPYLDCVVSIELKVATAQPTSVSTAVFGTLTDLGPTQYGASAGIIDYSIKSTDAFGGVTFVERPYSKRLSAQVLMKNTQLNRNFSLLSTLRATPCVWIASDDPIFDETGVVYGFYKDFSIDIAYPGHSLCNIEIEGLT